MSVQVQSDVAGVLGDPVAHSAHPLSASFGLLVSGVSKRWERKTVLDEIDVSLGPGTSTALVGANGAGKTTLLRIIAGLIAADQGTVTLDGYDVWADRREYQRRLGLVSAGQTGLYPRLSVEGHLEYWARLAFVPRGERSSAVEQTVERFGLHELRVKRPDRLSMGQRQRVRLAMGFLHDPHLVVLDEPHTSLDPTGMEVVSNAVQDYVSSGGMVIWCAPTVADTGWAFDRVCTLAGSRLVVS